MSFCSALMSYRVRFDVTEGLESTSVCIDRGDDDKSIVESFI